MTKSASISIHGFCRIWERSSQCHTFIDSSCRDDSESPEDREPLKHCLSIAVTQNVMRAQMGRFGRCRWRHCVGSLRRFGITERELLKRIFWSSFAHKRVCHAICSLIILLFSGPYMIIQQMHCRSSPSQPLASSLLLFTGHGHWQWTCAEHILTAFGELVLVVCQSFSGLHIVSGDASASPETLSGSPLETLSRERLFERLHRHSRERL